MLNDFGFPYISYTSQQQFPLVPGSRTLDLSGPDTLSGEELFFFSIFFSLFSMEAILNERICFSKSKFFPVRDNPLSEKAITPVSDSQNKNSAVCGVSPVSALSQNRAKHKNLTKVYATTTDTGCSA